MVRRACKKDLTHDAIRDALRKLGWDVIESYQFAQFDAGFPDLIATKWGFTVFIEVKQASAKLTKDEVDWWQRHEGMAKHILRTEGECVLLDEAYRRAA